MPRCIVIFSTCFAAICYFLPPQFLMFSFQSLNLVTDGLPRMLSLEDSPSEAPTYVFLPLEMMLQVSVPDLHQVLVHRKSLESADRVECQTFLKRLLALEPRVLFLDVDHSVVS